MQWTKKNGPTTKVKLFLKMSRAIFQQDGVRAQHACEGQDWCHGNFPRFCEKGTWSGNSPNLSPIKNLRAIVKEEQNKMKPAAL